MFFHKIQQLTDTCLSSETEIEAELWRVFLMESTFLKDNLF